MVLVYKVRMADGAAARTDGVSIWVDDRLNDVELRCAVEHEIEHIRRGHTSCQPEHVEMVIRYATAKTLLPERRLGSCNGDTLAEVARNHKVTKRVLTDRAATLTDHEARRAGCLSCGLCPAIQARFRVFELVGVA